MQEEAGPVVCGGCGALVDRVWSWCPDCGGLLSAGHLDLVAVEAALADGQRAALAGTEPYPTEWALSA